MSDDPQKNILLVKKGDVKKASLWSKLTNTRIVKQHGGLDIPEGDLHAIPKYDNPVLGKESSPEETKEVLTDLEKEIQLLKEKDKRTPPPQLPRHQSQEHFSHNQNKDYSDQDDDLF